MQICKELNLSSSEETLLNMHSILNILNVVSLEIELLALDFENPPEQLDKLSDEIQTIARNLGNSQDIQKEIDSINKFMKNTSFLFKDLKKTNVSANDNVENNFESSKCIDTFASAEKNIELIFSVLRVRLSEIEARSKNNLEWVEFSKSLLFQNFDGLFKVLVENSRHKYGIVHNIAMQSASDYLIYFDIDSNHDDFIFMPDVFQDVMRDLVANARKYTQPGGVIHAGLFQTKKELRFVVSDTGCGMSEDEIDAAVDFGKRCSNVQDKPTRGGGFGLTKAYYVTKKYSGSMWISSEINKGTKIEIILPVPCRS